MVRPRAQLRRVCTRGEATDRERKERAETAIGRERKERRLEARSEIVRENKEVCAPGLCLSSLFSASVSFTFSAVALARIPLAHRMSFHTQLKDTKETHCCDPVPSFENPKK